MLLKEEKLINIALEKIMKGKRKLLNIYKENLSFHMNYIVKLKLG